ncbi:Major sperm protein [Meloidogyne graminicola]|uniref:Major sperm protein n=1 Tax=Meloidogyne graminicola TaxID=189291 RepID=A0A8S9ZRP9_9BILA|nr:Major sperm protein [Meloidogyne graminicola]
MTKQPQILILEPSTELIFTGPFTEYVNTNLTLSNPASRDVYFKAKDKIQINVMLQPMESPEVLENERSRHKFMIQSAFAPDQENSGFGAMPPDQFWKEVDAAQVMDSKLRVVFQMPYGYSPTDVNASGMANSTTLSSVPSKYSEAKQMFRQDGDKGELFATDPQAALQKEIELRKMYQDEKTNLEKENFALMERIEQLARASHSVGSLAQQDSVPIIQVILFVVLALLVGLIIGKML